MSKVNGVVSAGSGGKTLRVKDLPDGEYAGTWSGYEALAVVAEMLCTFMTVEGVRGIVQGCVVTIKDGSATVRAVPAVDLDTVPHIW